MVASNVLILIVVAVIAFVLLSTPLKCGSAGADTEGFSNYFDHYGYYKRYCPSCGWRSRRSCSNCTNCGYCVTARGFGECAAGDSNGPYFRDDCMYWNYGDSNYSYTGLSSVYPVVKTKAVRRPKYNIRKPRRWRRWRKTY